MKTGFKILLIGLMCIGILSGVALGAPMIDEDPSGNSAESEYGISQEFAVNLNESSNVSWYINGSSVDSATNVTSDTYSNSSAEVGIYNVTVMAESVANGETSSYEWIWEVYYPEPPEPQITSNDPTSPTSSYTGVPKTFSIEIDQNVNVTWQIDDVNLTTNESVTSASYTNSSAPVGNYTVKAIAENANGSDEFSWNWEVSEPPEPQIKNPIPSGTSVTNNTGDSATFSIEISQFANVSWLLNGSEVKNKTDVDTSFYENSSAQEGVFNLTVQVNNDNGSDDFSWDWAVSNESLNIDESNPDSDPVSSEVDSIEFNISTNQNCDVVWYINGTEEKTQSGVSESSYVNDSAIPGTYNVTVKGSNVNGTVQKTWIWEVNSATYEWGNRIWDEEADQSTTYTWDGRSFSGFYYDLDTGDTSESMTIEIDVDGREIKENDLVYSTEPISKEFEYTGWDNYQIIGFMAERYFAGYKNTSASIVDSDLSLMSDGILAKVLLDIDDDESIYSGSSLALEEGYNLNIQQVDVNGNSVWMSLTKDGDEVDDAILSSGDTYVYEKDLGGVEDVPLIAVHIDSVF
ncbi:S-layer protein domain-containing protein, partial [Methanohalophilus sp. DAL1]|uniref:S-layer protein domain-containing protein n=1 Tax=Methanohalophilus sp. DAL1 TaxID=1864608 RepID=UPI0025BEF77D